MNVLVYAGPETTQASLHNTLAGLRSLLSSFYAVQIITQQSLASHPWTASCSLLVFPACPIQSISEAVSTRIQAFVENGGAFLGFSVGVETENTSPNAGLSFFDSIHGTRIYLTSGLGIQDSTSTQYHHHLAIQITGGAERRHIRGLAHIGGYHFSKDLHETPNNKIWAKYLGGEMDGETAALCCNIGAGKVMLWGPSLEYPVTRNDELTNCSSLLMSSEEQARAEEERKRVLQDTLLELGLNVPPKNAGFIDGPLPQYLTCDPSRPSMVCRILESLSLSSTNLQGQLFQDTTDTFHFHPFDDGIKPVQESRSSEPPASQQSSKHIIVCNNGRLPTREQTPLFDLALFYDAVARKRSAAGLPKAANNQWGMGQVLLYGELVTSTQTMLDKNPRFLSLIPTPLLSLASQQLSGRGRGSNIWLSPLGGLQFSLLLRVPLSRIPAPKLVLLQYLFGLAVTEACRDEDVLGVWGKNVRLKWPNDIYASFGHGENNRKKVGGVLVTTSFTGGNVDLVIGCGLNLVNAPPIPSLSQLLPEGTPLPRLENTAVAIVTKFEEMWDTFLANNGSFDPFIGLYLERWLHSDQLVTLTTTVPPIHVRIVGITDHGLLRTVPERRKWSMWDEAFIDLQPDGNSFDMMAGLIKVKNSW